MRLAYVTPNADAAVSVRKCARRMELKADERQYSWRFRPLASDSGPDRVFNLKNNAMTKLENRCADCGGKFGLVRIIELLALII